MVSTIALVASIFLFLLASGDQYFLQAQPRVALLYLCFAATNTAAYWVGSK